VPVPGLGKRVASDDDAEPRLVSDDRGDVIELDGYLVGLPNQVVELTRRDPVQVLLPGERLAKGVDELKVAGMQGAGDCGVAGHKGLQSLVFEGADLSGYFIRSRRPRARQRHDRPQPDRSAALPA
jgi:hypothetical protein